MKSTLLKKEDYDRIMKMGFTEALNFLAQHSYKTLERFNTNAQNFTQLEHLFAQALIEKMEKLLRICDPMMQKVITSYLFRFEIENLKIILRSKASKLEESFVEQLFYPFYSRFSRAYLKELYLESNLTEMIKKIEFLSKDEKKKSTLLEIEQILDRYYDSYLYDFAKSLKGQGKKLANFLFAEIETTNLKRILQIRFAYNLDPLPYLVHPTPFVEKASQKTTINEFLKLLSKERKISLSDAQKQNIEQIELFLERELLKVQSKLIVENMLDAHYIVSYFLMLEREVKNLLIILKAKLFHLSDEKIEPHLVIGK